MLINYWGLIHWLTLCYHTASCFHLQLTLNLVFIWTRGPGKLKNLQTLKCWFVGNLDYRKSSSLPAPMTGTIFMFLCLNIEHLFEIVRFKSVFQHLSPTPAQVTDQTAETNPSCGYFPCSPCNECLGYLSGIWYKKEICNYHNHWYMLPICRATNTLACDVKASEGLKLGKVMFFFLFFCNPRVNIKQTAFLLWALKKKKRLNLKSLLVHFGDFGKCRLARSWVEKLPFGRWDRRGAACLIHNFTATANISWWIFMLSLA